MQAPRFIRFLSGRRLDWSLAVLALAASLAPTAVLRPWTADLARVVSVPLAPVSHLGVFLRSRVRPEQGAFDPRAPETLALEQEVRQFRTLYEQARLENERLERSLAALAAVRARLGGSGQRLAEVSVVGTDASRRDGAARINAGTRHGLAAGAVALVSGDILVGVVGQDIGALSASVIPATKLPSLGVRLYPPQGTDPSTPLSAYPGAMLKPTARGTWTADVASTQPLSVGMVARLADDRYGRTALGARVGTIVAIEPVEKAPLARRVEIAPLAWLGEHPTLIVVVESGEGG